ncbi:GNAT family N-acetyltransferase [Halobacillus hunanensis]|uniref:GNAT family N-acetyltransferase n=1 Tax=Halobacillus hunanensis TaxID=578214 RepID=UPI0009A70A27|nr:GNAT family N-acetyltransferase [Halobacillus hunanensis]
MIIRPLSGSDASTYRTLRLEALQTNPDAFITTYEQEKNKPDAIETTVQRLNSDEAHTFGVFIEEKLVGNVTLQKEPHPKFSHKASILAMYVHPECRGQGAGEMLLEKAIQFAKGIGLEILQLSVVKDNLPAKKLYEKVGFREYGIEHKAIKIEDRYLDEILMEYFLQD